jgi:biopolymer transport protein ExbB
MKKLFAFAAVIGLLALGTTRIASAQTDSTATTTDTTAVTTAATTATDAAAVDAEVGGTPLHQKLKEKFIEGGAPWMAPILLCLILGLAIIIERVFYLNLATTNADKLLRKIEDALNTGGVEAAKEVCRNTRGPVASIFYQGLDRYHEGIDVVEKSVVSYGSVQMGLLEKGFSWITLFIALSPMLGFLGTVVGMVQAFDDIQKAGDVSPTIVASGMKVALITTVGGLIVAMILQVFYNYLLAKVEGIVNTMEDASITLIDIIVKFSKK